MRTWRASVGPLLWAIPLAGLSFLPVKLLPSARTSANSEEQSQAATVGVVRTTTRFVQVSVIATDKKGQPVSDLTADDFVVLDDGHRQKIEIFRKETNQVPAQPPAKLPPDTYTNQMRQTVNVPANITMLLLDGLNTEITDQGHARQQVLKFLQQIQPQDRLAIFTLGRDLRVLQEFTSDSSKLVAAVNKYVGRTTVDLAGSTPDDTQIGNQDMDALLQNAFQREANMYIEDRVLTTVNALIDIANYAAALPGRKNLLWVSGSFPFSVGYENLQNIVQMMNDSKREANLPGQQLIFAQDVERAARALNDANVAVYPVDARGLLELNMNTNKGSNQTPAYSAMNSGQQTGNLGAARGNREGSLGGARKLRGPDQNSSPKQNGIEKMLTPDSTTFQTMDALANGTGGKAFYNSNDIASALLGAVNDARETYEIGYYPSGVKWDGSYHKIEVQLKKPDVEVRARKGYFALPGNPPSAEAINAMVTSAVVSPLESTALGLAVRVKAITAENDTSLTAMIFFDPRSLQFEAKGDGYSGTANLVLAQLNDKNQVLDAAQQSFPLNLPARQYQQFLRQQAEFTQQINVMPAAVQLRVVLCDGNSGKLGAVTVPLAKYVSAKSPHN